MLKFEVPEGVSITDGQLIDGVSLDIYGREAITTITDFMGSVVNDEAGLGEYVVIDFTIPASQDEYTIKRIGLKSGSTEIAVSDDTYIEKEANKNLKVRLSAQFEGASKCRFERTSINLPYATPYREGVVRFVSDRDDSEGDIYEKLVYSAADVDEKVSEIVSGMGGRFVSWDVDNPSSNNPLRGNLTVSTLTIENIHEDDCAAILTCTTDNELSIDSHIVGDAVYSSYYDGQEGDDNYSDSWNNPDNRPKLPTVGAVKDAIDDTASDLQRQIDGINAGQNLADIVNDRSELAEYDTYGLKAEGDLDSDGNTFLVGDKIQVLQDTWDDSFNDGEGGENDDLDGVGTIYELVKGKSDLGIGDDATGDPRDINVNNSVDEENPDWYHWEYIGPYGMSAGAYVKLESDTAQDITSDLNINGTVSVGYVDDEYNRIENYTTITSNRIESASTEYYSDNSNSTAGFYIERDEYDTSVRFSHIAGQGYLYNQTTYIEMANRLEAYNFTLNLNEPEGECTFRVVRPVDGYNTPTDTPYATGNVVADYKAATAYSPDHPVDGRLVTVDYLDSVLYSPTSISKLSSVNALGSVGLFLYTKPGNDLPIGSIVAGLDLQPVGLTLPLSGQISYKSSANNNTYTGQWKLLSMAVKRTDTEPCLVIAQKYDNFTQVSTPLCFTVTNGSAGVSLNKVGSVSANYKYSTDGTTWSDYTIGTTISLSNVGDKVYFKGSHGDQKSEELARYNWGITHVYFTITGTGNVAASGNVNSMISENFENIHSLEFYGKNTFYEMFSDCISLTHAPELPATELTESCYKGMFLRCASLQTAPELPAVALANNCYESMFFRCESLTSAPALPSMVLYNECYRGMFRECTSLETAPELPATKLAEDCYNSMFYGCTGLTSAPELPATTLASDCYREMFQGCTSLTVAPELPATTLAPYCYYYMFQGCTSLETAPELPAVALANNCYESMFFGCESLTSAPELPATTLAYACYSDMFSGCKGLTSAPELPATELDKWCYFCMFSGCESLTQAPELPAAELAEYCYSNMFNGCTSLEVAPELPAVALANHCYESMFRGCTSLETAPELPATTLAYACYSDMFSGCTSLNEVKCYATDITASQATDYWLSDTSSTGTFYKDANTTWPEGESGIPSGWAVVDI